MLLFQCMTSCVRAVLNLAELLRSCESAPPGSGLMGSELCHGGAVTARSWIGHVSGGI